MLRVRPVEVKLSTDVGAVAGYFGNKAYPVASIVLCLVNLVFLSPITWAVLASENMKGGSALMTITIVIFIVPIVALFFGKKEAPESRVAD